MLNNKSNHGDNMPPDYNRDELSSMSVCEKRGS